MEMVVGSLLLFGIPVLIALMALMGCFYLVEQQSVRFVERFHRFVRIGTPGLNFKIPFIERVSSTFSLKIQELKIETETKTKDNVFVLLEVAVQYVPIGDNYDSLVNSYYRLTDPRTQIRSFVDDAIRAHVPDLSLDDVFVQKNTVGDSIEAILRDRMGQYGYTIERVLLVDIRPDAKVQEAMNEINAAQRLREAAVQKAEAEKIVIVKNAEAQKESKILQGEGIAGERKAIVEGMREAIHDLAKQTGQSEAEAMQYVQFTQYTDMLREVGKVGTTVIMPMSSNELLKSLMVNNGVQQGDSRR